MRTILTMALGSFIGAITTQKLIREQRAFEKSKHESEIQTWRDSLSKCNGITARINKDSTYYIKNK